MLPLGTPKLHDKEVEKKCCTHACKCTTFKTEMVYQPLLGVGKVSPSHTANYDLLKHC